MRSSFVQKVLASVLACFLLLLAACGGDDAKVKPTPTSTGDPNQLVTYKLGIPDEAINAPKAGNLPGDTPMHVKVTFKTNQAELERLEKENQFVPDGQERDVAALANQIGISDQTYEKIKAFFGVQDAKLSLGKLHTSLTIDARAQTFARLLDTTFVYHELDGRKFFTPEKTELQLPRIVVDNLEAVTGLDNYSVPPSRSSSFPQQTSKRSAKNAAGNCDLDFDAVTPAAIGHVYGAEDLWKKGWYGKGTTVNLIEFEAFNPDDVNYYFDCVGYKGNLKVVNVGQEPELTGQEGEATLDIEMVAGIAPMANMVVYQTGLSDETTWVDYWGYFLDQLDQIIADNSKVSSPNLISISWGGSENRVTTEIMKALANRFQVLYQTERMTSFVASGDCGPYDDGRYGKLSVDVPSAIPYVTSVGGTTLSFDQNGNRASEVTWANDQDKTVCKNRWGSGGGLSRFFKRPSWQQGRGVQNQYSNGSRQIPDVAAVATNIPIYLNGEWVPVGGTSAAAPIWAASLAVVNEALIRQTHYYVYGPQIFYIVASNSGKSHPYYDVQQGKKLYYPTTAGWDFATGLGVPHLSEFQKVVVQLIQKSKK